MLWETKTGSPVHYTEASERRDYDDRSIETSAKGGVRLGSAGRRATHSPALSDQQGGSRQHDPCHQRGRAGKHQKVIQDSGHRSSPCVHGTFVRLP